MILYESSSNSKHRLDRWELVRSVINHGLSNATTDSKRHKSLANIVLHLPDITKTDVDSLSRALRLELGQDIAELFAKRLHRAFYIESNKKVDAWADVYPPPTPSIDARYIIVTYKAAISAACAFYNPRRLLLTLLADFTVNHDDEDRLRLEDVLSVVSIASITDEEKICTSDLLKQHIQQQLETTKVPCYINADVLHEVLRQKQNILDNFRDQVLSKLTSTQRLKVLAEEEDLALRGFITCSKKIGLQRMNEYRSQRLKKLFRSWRLECYLSKRYKRLMKKNVTTMWQQEARQSRLLAFCESLSSIMHYQSLMRRLFYKWKLFYARMRKIERCFISETTKQIISGVGYVRRCIASVQIRHAIAIWLEFVRCCRNEEKAVLWNQKKTMHWAFAQYRQRSTIEVDIRKRGRKASFQMKHVEALIVSIDSMRSRQKYREYLDNRYAILKAEKDRIGRLNASERRQSEIEKQIAANILIQQRELRRQRVEFDLRRLENLFESKWAIKLANEISASESAIDRWMKSPDFTNLCCKREKEIMRMMSLESGIKEEQEMAINNPAVIAYSILDSQLSKGNMCVEEFLTCMKSDEIGLHEFSTALDTLLNANQIQDLFDDLCQHSTTSEPTKQKAIAITDLNEYRRLSDEYIAPSGALWKIYVCPFKQKLVFHCVSLSKNIYETNLSKKDIKQIAKENLLSVERMKLRRNLFHEKCKAKQLTHQHYRAKQIQFMYRTWKARKARKRRWRVV